MIKLPEGFDFENCLSDSGSINMAAEHKRAGSHELISVTSRMISRSHRHFIVSDFG